MAVVAKQNLRSHMLTPNPSIERIYPGEPGHASHLKR